MHRLIYHSTHHQDTATGYSTSYRMCLMTFHNTTDTIIVNNKINTIQKFVPF